MCGSPRSEQFDDIYFAVEDGLEETKHVFLQGSRLPERWQRQALFTIAETGFGTGLNFLAAWRKFEETSYPGQKLKFISFEKYPLSAGQIREYLSVWKNELGPHLDRLVSLYPARISGWHHLQVSDRVSLLLIFDDVNRALPDLDAEVDAWFLDGHAPAKNPEMWSETVFREMRRLSVSGATFATFTAAGIVKRGLAEAGFKVEKAAGFGRKRDMLTGIFSELRQSRGRNMSRKVAVVGGGLAGTGAAYFLRRYGHEVDLFEKVHLGAGPSGNPLGLFNPRLSAARTADADFYSSAYALALRTFRDLQQDGEIDYQTCGSLHLMIDEDKARRFLGSAENWNWHHDHMQLIDCRQASAVAHIELTHQALFLPDSGTVSPAKICARLAAGCTLFSEDAAVLRQTDNGWLVNGRAYDAVVIASGAACVQYPQLENLPVGTVRGQLSYAPATARSRQLKTNLCYGGYCSVAIDGLHTLGSTFQPWLTGTELRIEDDERILRQFEAAVPDLKGEIKISGGRAALRTTSKDRIPVGGAVNGYPGLYISTAHGSHGLLSSLMIAAQIAAELAGQGAILPRSVRQKISPGRFIP